MDASSSGPDPVYEVFTDINQPSWVNQTVIYPGKLGQEYPKTFGHYHGVKVDEIYHLVEGEGVLILQTGRTTNDERRTTDKVVLIKMKPGDEIKITPEWGHAWSNTGQTSLVAYDNWSAGHTEADYQEIKNLHGMAYYLIEQDKQVHVVKNPHYQNLPEAVWMTAAEFNAKIAS